MHQHFIYVCFTFKAIQWIVQKHQTLTRFCESLYVLSWTLVSSWSIHWQVSLLTLYQLNLKLDLSLLTVTGIEERTALLAISIEVHRCSQLDFTWPSACILELTRTLEFWLKMSSFSMTDFSGASTSNVLIMALRTSSIVSVFIWLVKHWWLWVARRGSWGCVYRRSHGFRSTFFLPISTYGGNWQPDYQSLFGKDFLRVSQAASRCHTSW